ncbi:MAG: ABC transporter permease [Micrococcales bacterium]|nr:ABC transporter permease [Micrococcales bacterium]
MERPVKSLLIAAVFALGSGGFVSALGLSQTASHQITQKLTPRDIDEVTIRASAGDGNEGAPALPANAKNALAALEGVTSVGEAVPLTRETARVSRWEQPTSGQASANAPQALGVDTSWLSLNRVVSTPVGTQWQLRDANGLRDQALVGAVAARRLGLGSPAPGVSVWVGGRRFDVIGVVTSAGRRPDVDNAVLVSLSAAKAIDPAATPEVVVRTRPGYASAVAKAAPVAISATAPSLVQVDPVLDLSNLRRGVSTDLDRIVAMASGLVLLLAGLTIANASVVSVLNRRGEIGLRRALGASRWSIARLFLLEGGVTGLAGGLIGLPIGMAVVIAVAVARGWTPVLSMQLVPLALLTGAVAGVLFSAYPAWRATRIEPAEAVRQRD